MMKDWYVFVTRNKRLLNFGFLFHFFSSFGQTFFVSMFLPFWVVSVSISNTAFGSLYASVTIASAVLLPFTGKYIDRMSLYRYGWMVFAALLVSIVILSQAYHVATLALGLLLVRFLGQGLMTHTSSTGIARLFDENRGKALGVTALGHPAAQFLFPLITLPLIALTGWRTALLIMAAVSLVVMIPSMQAMKSVEHFVAETASAEGSDNRSHHGFLKSLDFWIMSLNIFAIPFICTAVFLYQYTIGQSKGWDTGWIAFSFMFFALFNALSLLFSGPLVDRFSARFLFPLYLLPSLLALGLMALTNLPWTGPLFYALLGISAGLGSTIKTSVQVEVYGTYQLGRIKSYFSTILVLSTALGPPVFGYFIDQEFSFNAVMGLSSLFMLFVVLLSFRFWKAHATKIQAPW